MLVRLLSLINLKLTQLTYLVNMPLVKETLKQEIKALATEMTKETDQEAALEKYATRLADIIDSYIKSATVTVQAGQAVQTVPTTGTGTTTSPGTGSLS